MAVSAKIPQKTPARADPRRPRSAEGEQAAKESALIEAK
jgi:hypothetical protein